MKDCAHVPELSGRQLPAAAKARPTIEELREYLDYDAESGALTWKKSPGLRRHAKQGQLVNAVLSGCGYKEIRFRGCRLYAHRVVFALHYGRWPTPRCDHIDGNKTNNRADNLRECSASENGHNGKMHRDNATGVKGVFRYVRSGYGTEVMSNGVRHRKWFRRLEDAAAHVKQLREQLHGDFARHE
jgi:hypothetical protein